MKTLILIPAHNEEKAIGTLLDQIEESGLRKLADVLVVDDYSTDRTGVIVRAHGEITVRNVFNLGYGSALQLGYKYAVRRGYECVVQLDADGQHDVCNIKNLMDAMQTADEQGRTPDIVIGSRFLKGSESFPVSGIKRISIRMFCMMLRQITHQRFTDPTSGLQALSREAFLYYSAYNNFNSRYPDANMITQMALLGFRITEIPAVMHARDGGESMHSGIIKPAFYMMVMMVAILTVTIRDRRGSQKRPVDWSLTEK